VVRDLGFRNLKIRGVSLDFDDIRESLGLVPTKTVRKGDRGRVLSDGWLFTVEKDGSTISDLLAILETHLHDRPAAVQELARIHDVCIWCSHQTPLAMSGFDLTPENLAFLARLDVRFTVSVFSFGEVRNDTTDG